MYRSRLEEQTAAHGAFTAVTAAKAQIGSLERQGVDNFKELTFPEKKAIHNLKYYTWVEQQGKTYEEICAQWQPEYLDRAVHRGGRRTSTSSIEKFNAGSGPGLTSLRFSAPREIQRLCVQLDS